jgi:hypothetical protein
LRVREDCPAGQRAAEKSNKFASSDVNCHLPSPIKIPPADNYIYTLPFQKSICRTLPPPPDKGRAEQYEIPPQCGRRRHGMVTHLTAATQRARGPKGLIE